MVIDDMIFNRMIVDSGDSFYKGTLPIDIKEFPMVPDIIKKGKDSNIDTGMMGVGDPNNPKDERVILFPRMRKGKLLSEKEIDKMIKAGEHFGIYNSKEEADWVDSYIHDEFRRQSNGE